MLISNWGLREGKIKPANCTLPTMMQQALDFPLPGDHSTHYCRFNLQSFLETPRGSPLVAVWQVGYKAAFLGVGLRLARPQPQALQGFLGVMCKGGTHW